VSLELYCICAFCLVLSGVQHIAEEITKYVGPGTTNGKNRVDQYMINIIVIARLQMAIATICNLVYF